MPAQVSFQGTVVGEPFRMTVRGRPVQVFALQVDEARYLVVEPDTLNRQPAQQISVAGSQFVVSFPDPSGNPAKEVLAWSYLFEPGALPDLKTLRAVAEDYATVTQGLPW